MYSYLVNNDIIDEKMRNIIIIFLNIFDMSSIVGAVDSCHNWLPYDVSFSAICDLWRSDDSNVSYDPKRKGSNRCPFAQIIHVNLHLKDVFGNISATNGPILKRKTPLERSLNSLFISLFFITQLEKSCMSIITFETLYGPYLSS